MEQVDVVALVKRIKDGDQQAFGMLYDEFADRIYSFICIKVTDSVQAEDILQEVFLKAWKSRSKLALEELNFSAWLFKICIYSINDYYRKIYRKPPSLPLDISIDVEGVDDAPLRVEASIDAEILNRALEKLPLTYRQVLELRCIQEFSIKETAEIMQKSSASVRVLQHRAMQKLEEIFKYYE